MNHKLYAGKRAISMSLLFPDGERTLLPIITFPFIIGVLIGTAFGLYSDRVFCISAIDYFEASALQFIWHDLRFLLFVVVFSTSYLGVVLTPALAACCGFLYSHSVSFVYRNEGIHGLLEALIQFGIPFLVYLPSLILLCCLGFRASAAILPNCEKSSVFASRRVISFRHLLFIFCSTVAGIAYRLLFLFFSR